MLPALSVLSQVPQLICSLSLSPTPGLIFQRNWEGRYSEAQQRALPQFERGFGAMPKRGATRCGSFAFIIMSIPPR